MKAKIVYTWYSPQYSNTETNVSYCTFGYRPTIGYMRSRNTVNASRSLPIGKFSFVSKPHFEINSVGFEGWTSKSHRTNFMCLMPIVFIKPLSSEFRPHLIGFPIPECFLFSSRIMRSAVLLLFYCNVFIKNDYVNLLYCNKNFELSCFYPSYKIL